MGRWRRHSVLIWRGALRTTLVALVWPLVSVRLAWWSLDRLPIQSSALHIIAGEALLTLAAFVLIAPRDSALSFEASSETLLRFAVTAAGFTALAVWAGIPLAKYFSAIGVATLCAAFAEEIVFRHWIPARLAVEDTPSAALLLILPQVSFSLAHAANPSFIAARPMEFVSFFIAGLLYRGLAQVGGLGMAAAVHGALNLALT